MKLNVIKNIFMKALHWFEEVLNPDKEPMFWAIQSAEPPHLTQILSKQQKHTWIKNVNVLYKF